MSVNRDHLRLHMKRLPSKLVPVPYPEYGSGLFQPLPVVMVPKELKVNSSSLRYFHLKQNT